MQMADLLEAPLNTNSVVTAGVSRETLRRYVEAIQRHSSDVQNLTHDEKSSEGDAALTRQNELKLPPLRRDMLKLLKTAK